LVAKVIACSEQARSDVDCEGGDGEHGHCEGVEKVFHLVRIFELEVFVCLSSEEEKEAKKKVEQMENRNY
jgi:hypothetical protein